MPQGCVKSESRSKSRKGIICHYCKKSRHMKKEHWQLKKKNEKKDEKETSTIASDGDPIVFSGCDKACISLTCQDTDCIVDTGASYHATQYKDFYVSYKSSDFGVVRIGNILDQSW